MKKRVLLLAIRVVLWRVANGWCRSLRITKVHNGPFEELRRSGKNYVVAFWHGSMFVGWFLHAPENGQRVSALVSQSHDGEFLSALLEKWRYSMIRGSSHIGGREAMQLMENAVAGGSALAITPDGPRGPRHEMKMGAVRIAQKLNVPLVLAGIAMEKKRMLKSWDRFEVPMPFSSVVVKYSEPAAIPVDLTGEPLDGLKLEKQKELLALTKDAELLLSGRAGGS